MSIRDDRAAAVRRYYRDLGDSLHRALPGLLDALDAIDAKHGTGPVSVKREDDAPTDAQIEAWAGRNPKQAEKLILQIGARHARRSGGDVQRVIGAAPASKPPMTALPPTAQQAQQAAQAEPTKPAPRRRTRT